MRRYPPARGGFLSPLLLKAMAETLERKEQSLCFSTGAAMRR
jgi:primosomal protein N' (replication factor Y)